ncbi:hypothetical protein [Comamonas antarctica]|uniref:Uncharacterized protein n=1 Tax=Comamonas antarctica TaxID=2743470 RepID=A0A6N1X4C6_9BURK|nr:hypothetical protein [Comamonas antarctica]QKV52630.1 hypothetical protein HUK68_06775 [Comamonas antarctica]
MTIAMHMTRHRSGTLDRPTRISHIALRLAETELVEALTFAQAEGRSAGNFARLVYLMGVNVYRAQGYLAMPEGAAQPQRSRWQQRSGLVNEKPIALRLTAEELAEAQVLAASEERTPGNLARVLFHMGMQVYRKTSRIVLPKAPAVAGLRLN